MKIQSIMALKREALKKAQKEVDRVFAEYSILIVEEIKKQLPENTILMNGNGMCMLTDKSGQKIISGKAWGYSTNNPKLDKISLLQYGTDTDELQGNFYIPREIFN